MGSGIHHIIDRQVRRWEAEARARRQAIHDPAVQQPSIRPWVTISRAFGSGGGEIAHRLATALGYQIFDREILDVIVEEGRFRSAILEYLDERDRSSLEIWIQGILHGNLVDKGDYLRTLIGVLGSIAMHGHAIIIGRGANFVLDHRRGVHVRVVAPLPQRVETIGRLRSLSYAEAEKLVLDTDHERAAFIRHHFHRDIDDPLAYDLTVNTGWIGIEGAIALIEHGLRRKLAHQPNVRF